MVPSLIGMLLIAGGLGCLYVAIHGLPGLLSVQPPSTYGVGGYGPANQQ